MPVTGPSIRIVIICSAHGLYGSQIVMGFGFSFHTKATTWPSFGCRYGSSAGTLTSSIGTTHISPTPTIGCILARIFVIIPTSVTISNLSAAYVLPFQHQLNYPCCRSICLIIEDRESLRKSNLLMKMLMWLTVRAFWYPLSNAMVQSCLISPMFPLGLVNSAPLLLLVHTFPLTTKFHALHSKSCSSVGQCTPFVEGISLTSHNSILYKNCMRPV
jgi:hypothetical protein